MHEPTSNLAGSTCEKVLLLIFIFIKKYNVLVCLQRKETPASAQGKAKAKAKPAGKPAKKKAKTGGMHAE